MVEKNRFDFGNRIPTNDEIFDLMSKWGLPDGIREHSIVVKDIAMDFVRKIHERDPNVRIDARVVEAGALLHDIGRVKSHGLDHGYRGYQALVEARVDERVARCALVHVLGGFTVDDIKREFPGNSKDIRVSLMPQSIEEKIVCFADKHAVGSMQVSVKKRFSRWFKKHGRTPFLLKSRYRIMQLDKDIKSLL
ncbi:MAG: HDIG domain-containing protein [Candidatus Lokiarchaeota archaeon]|nr:HDIG domain-containing protein [Candidatus Lokiarchaeota archaeon]